MGFSITSPVRIRVRAKHLLCLLLGCAVVSATGCQKETPQATTAETLVVPVAHPVSKDVTDFYDFTGRTDAVNSVNIIARVTGYLVKMPFQEGSDVKKGDLLFEVNPRPYQAQLDQAENQVNVYDSQLKLAETTLKRYEALDKTTPGAVSKQALDQYAAAVAVAKAQVEAQRASLKVFELNKEFTQVMSPIDGQVSRYYLTLGNLVNQDQTLLTTVVSVDPMYAYFDMDERTLLQIRKAVKEGKVTPPADGDVHVKLGLQNEEDFPHEGTVNFVNNQVNSTTGSITIRGVFENPKLLPEPSAGSPSSSSATATGASSSGEAPKRPSPSPMPTGASKRPASSTAPKSRTARQSSPRLFSPGMFVRIRLPIGGPHPALLVKDSVIQSDQGLKFVYVVDSQKKIQTRNITTGALQEDGLRVVTGEIKQDDWVVVGGLQQVRLRMEVNPEEGEMPTLRGRGTADTKPADQTRGARAGQAKGAKTQSRGKDE